MKKIISSLLLSLTLTGAYANVVSEVTTVILGATTLAPTQTVYDATMGVSGSIQRRGVAYQEQLRDELVELNDDIIAGRVQSVEDISQPALKELAKEIQEDEEQMKEISAVVSSDSELVKIVTAIAIAIQ